MLSIIVAGSGGHLLNAPAKSPHIYRPKMYLLVFSCFWPPFVSIPERLNEIITLLLAGELREGNDTQEAPAS